MKKSILLGTLIALASATVAMASPITLPDGPIYIKFNNVEQISTTNGILTPDGHRWDNWGLVDVTDVFKGSSTIPANQLFGKAAPIWNESMTGQITGIFGGAVTSPGTGGALNSTGGSIYLYWSDTKTLTNYELPKTLADIATNWVSDFVYTGVADPNTMTLLAKIDFMNGAILPGDPNTSITGTALPSALGFAGFADSFGKVDRSAGGAWAAALDNNFFNTLLGPNTADIRFKNSYNDMTSWDDFSDPNNPIFGAISDDPARANVAPVPEPATLSLLGLGLFAAAVISKRRRA